jgi:hypothetical protein
MKRADILATIGISSIMLVLMYISVSCVFPAPILDPTTGKVETNPDGTTKFEGHITPGRAKKGIEAAMDSKGFKRYKADVAQISAMHWINISKWCGILAGLFVLAWYFTKIRECGGAAIICVAFSVVAVTMAELVSNIGKLLLFSAGALIIALGIYLRHKSITSYFRKLSS